MKKDVGKKEGMEEMVNVGQYKGVELNQVVKSETSIFNREQLNMLLGSTPKSQKKKRKGKGGKEWEYVNGVYVKKVLNIVFGWDWDFKIVEWRVFDPSACVVLGRLTCRHGGRVVVKEQFGRSDIKYWEGKAKTPENYLDIGSDLKGAATDAMKKCGNMLGIADDVYGKEDFKSIFIEDPSEDFEFRGKVYGARVDYLLEIARVLNEECLTAESVRDLLNENKRWRNNAHIMDLIGARLREFVDKEYEGKK